MILARVRRTIRERGLVEPGMRVLAACSGGPDSGAMLVALARLGAELDFTLEAASVDHGLRAEAAADVAIAREQAAAAGVRVPCAAASTVERDRLAAGGRARRALRGAAGARARDAARSASPSATRRTTRPRPSLLRVLRGAGLAGLSGIEPLRADGVMRPLIDCRRADVLAFATQHCPRCAQRREQRGTTISVAYACAKTCCRCSSARTALRSSTFRTSPTMRAPPRSRCCARPKHCSELHFKATEALTFRRGLHSRARFGARRCAAGSRASPRSTSVAAS